MQLQITIGFLIVGLSGAAQAADAGTDPYQWLEEPGGPRVLQWIHTENQRTLAALASDARFARFESEALAVDEAQDRIPMPAQLAGGIEVEPQRVARVAQRLPNPAGAHAGGHVDGCAGGRRTGGGH